MPKQGPIGIFDSGVGGLSIAREVHKLLPDEHLVYVADQAFSPYGSQEKQLIETRSEWLLDHFCQRGCKAVVVACNTATVNTIHRLRKSFPLPIIGVEPGIKPAAQQSKSGIIGVLATPQTLNSKAFQMLKERFTPQVKIETQACPKFVELVEAVDLDSDATQAAVKEYVLPLLDKGADQLVLGCTHYSFLAPCIESVIGTNANLVDTAAPVAIEVRRRLEDLSILADSQDPIIEFYSSNASNSVAERISSLWGSPVQVKALGKV